jgi:hypothetical protein
VTLDLHEPSLASSGLPYQVLSDDGRELTGPAPEISDADLRAMLTEMIKARICSARFFSLQRQGRAGTYAPIDGQEASVVGAAAALDPSTDWVVPQYREPVALGRYGPEVLERYALYQRGHPSGSHIPAPIRVFPIQISLAAQIPHAVGLAWAMKLKREPGVVCVFFGDGASSEGDFYEAANFAGVLRAPVVFLCVNNGWAISTPLRLQTAAESFAAKAAAFGFPGVRVDGNDALAMYAAGRLGPGADAPRGGHLPDGTPHHGRRPQALPAARGPQAMGRAGPHRAPPGPPRLPGPVGRHQPGGGRGGRGGGGRRRLGEGRGGDRGP